MKKYLIDSSFMIDLLNEIADGRQGDAMNWLRDHPAARLWITPVTMAEVLEGAEQPEAVKAYLARYSWQGIHRAHADKVALRQRRSARRMGENDAWQAAIAETMGALVLGHDEAFGVLGAGYADHHDIAADSDIDPP
jgi:predicted nucleic acid-binding protein